MNKIAFLSYAHEDKDFAERITTELLKAGIDVKIDIWEIKPGDSLIQKIFVEGLSTCDVFLILISDASVRSKWVREALDHAMIKKIEGATRIIALIKEKSYLEDYGTVKVHKLLGTTPFKFGSVEANAKDTPICRGEM